MIRWIGSMLHYAWIVIVVDLVLVGTLASFVYFQVSVMGKDLIVGKR